MQMSNPPNLFYEEGTPKAKYTTYEELRKKNRNRWQASPTTQHEKVIIKVIIKFMHENEKLVSMPRIFLEQYWFSSLLMSVPISLCLCLFLVVY